MKYELVDNYALLSEPFPYCIEDATTGVRDFFGDNRSMTLWEVNRRNEDYARSLALTDNIVLGYN